MSNTVLVTGGFGLVGSATVRRLAELGRNVVATDLDTPANRKAAAKLPSGVNARWTDLTDTSRCSGSSLMSHRTRLFTSQLSSHRRSIPYQRLRVG